MRKFIMLSLMGFYLAGCSALTGEEVGRLAINTVSSEEGLITKETTINLKQGDEIVFWSDMDISYEGDAALRFRLTIQKEGASPDNLEIDPTVKDMTLGEVKTTLGNKTTWSFSGRNFIFNVQEDGRYNFKAILVASENSSLTIRKAELVIKKL
jgi:hypothetical protein